MISRGNKLGVPAMTVYRAEQRTVQSMQHASLRVSVTIRVPVSLFVPIVRTSLPAAMKYTMIQITYTAAPSKLIQKMRPSNASTINARPRTAAAVIIPIVAFPARDAPPASIFFVRAAICSHLHTFIMGSIKGDTRVGRDQTEITFVF
jgi:hypothetical protein